LTKLNGVTRLRARIARNQSILARKGLHPDELTPLAGEGPSAKPDIDLSALVEEWVKQKHPPKQHFLGGNPPAAGWVACCCLPMVRDSGTIACIGITSDPLANLAPSWNIAPTPFAFMRATASGRANVSGYGVSWHIWVFRTLRSKA
jgi:hypothetical protein